MYVKRRHGGGAFSEWVAPVKSSAADLHAGAIFGPIWSVVEPWIKFKEAVRKGGVPSSGFTWWWFGRWSEGLTTAVATVELSGFKNGDGGGLGCVPRGPWVVGEAERERFLKGVVGCGSSSERVMKNENKGRGL